jgi:hypothetical protein
MPSAELCAVLLCVNEMLNEFREEKPRTDLFPLVGPVGNLSESNLHEGKTVRFSVN